MRLEGWPRAMHRFVAMVRDARKGAFLTMRAEIIKISVQKY
jgi:hypothetical protein